MYVVEYEKSSLIYHAKLFVMYLTCLFSLEIEIEMAEKQEY